MTTAQIQPQLAPPDVLAPGSPERFTGAVQVGPVVERAEPQSLAVYEVFFAAGARTVWHEHMGDQLLVGFTGSCLVQVQGQRDAYAPQGRRSVFAPAGATGTLPPRADPPAISA